MEKETVNMEKCIERVLQLHGMGSNYSATRVHPIYLFITGSKVALLLDKLSFNLKHPPFCSVNLAVPHLSANCR